MNGTVVKPAATVRVGDRVEVRGDDGRRTFEVTEIIDKRVGAPLAVLCYVDYSPAPPPRGTMAPVPRRDPGAGRPTKRDRRDLDRLHGR